MNTMNPLLGLSCLMALTAAAMSDQDCGEGRVRDLDGSCVKKFVIPKEKLVCPKLSIDNGDIFLLGTGRMAQFYCDTDYIRVPDTEIAICQVTGHWSKVVPACLKPGCQAPASPHAGEVELLEEYNNTVAVFSCRQGHHLTGQTVLGCVDGKRWNGSSPECLEIVSDRTAGTSSGWVCQSNNLNTFLALLLAFLLQ